MSRTSYIITTYNRHHLLERGLATILNQTVLPDEIVVVDDGSRDGTMDWMRSLDNPLIKYVYVDYPEPRISCIPRNVGIKQATGDILLFTEPEALHMKDNTEKMLKAMEQYPENTILASQVWTTQEKIGLNLTPDYYADPEKILNHPYAQIVSGNMQNTKAPDSDWAITGEMNCNAGIFFGTHKQWLLDIGGFDEDFQGFAWDDFDLFNRLALYGHGIQKVSDIPVIHMWHDKSFYPYDIYAMGEANGKKSEARIHAGEYRANIGKSWGVI